MAPNSIKQFFFLLFCMSWSSICAKQMVKFGARCLRYDAFYSLRLRGSLSCEPSVSSRFIVYHLRHEQSRKVVTISVTKLYYINNF